MFNCTGDRPFALDLERLALKVGCSSSERSLAKFKRQLRDIAETDVLPEYRVELSEEKLPTSNGRPRVVTMVRMFRRGAARVELSCKAA